MSKALLDYLIAKLLEPSTHKGLAVIAAATGFGGLQFGLINAELWQAIATVAGVYYGAVDIIRKEREAARG